ncbi:MAG: hypothetical protein Q9160_006422 [Pyrenula sp. 1 TL-2023]
MAAQPVSIPESNKVLDKQSRIYTQSVEESFTSNPFADPKVAEHYRNIYEEAKYECRHAFDPELEWEPAEEKKLVRKLDWHVCLWACIMFFALQVDRGNLAQAVSDNMLDQLGLTTNEFNYEGGFIPDLVLWLSYFYTSGELPIRLSFFWTATSVTDIITSLLAFALLHMDGISGLAGWRWLFLIEGLLTGAVGVAAFFLMPASAVQTKTWFRPNGWFTDRQVGIVVNRILRDDPSKGDMHNRMAITPKRLLDAMLDYDLWPTTGVQSAAAIGIGTLLGITWLSERVNERSLISMIQDIWTLPCVIALRWWSGTYKDAWGTYALVTVLLSYPYTHAIIVAWASRNSGSVRTRSVSAALYNMMVQCGNVISYNIYRADDKPLYHRGNSVLIGINFLAIALFVITKVYYVWKNRVRERKWNAMTAEERKHYLDNTNDEGNKRLDFRFMH